jgi:hypothetical protein
VVTAAKSTSSLSHYKVRPDRNVIEMGKSRFDYSKVRDLFGKDLCWARAITLKADPDQACPYLGQRGHCKGDPLHTWSDSRREYFLRNVKSFTLPEQPQSPRPQPKPPAGLPPKSTRPVPTSGSLRSNKSSGN